MNDVFHLISRLKKLDIGIELVDDQLKLNAPKGVLTPGIIDELKDKKTEIIDFLKKRFQKRVGLKAIEPSEKKEYYQLSTAQKRLYILQQMEVGNTSYHLSIVLWLEGEIDIEKLEATFRTLISRHESLRTSFEILEGKPVQRIHRHVQFEIEYDRSLVNGQWSLENCQGRGEVPSPIKDEKIIRDFIRPFDLSQAPLLRVGLIEVKQCQHLLVVDMHHIITDGMSHTLLTNEFASLYAGKVLPLLKLQYKDYSEWQQINMAEKAFKRQETYWRRQFSGEIPILSLDTDFPRPAEQSFEGNTIHFDLSVRETRPLKELARSEGGTLFVVLLAIFNIFLSKLSSQEDIIVGTPVVGRVHADLELIIGMFVNMLALRGFPSGEKRFDLFFRQVMERTFKAFENQSYPFEALVENVELERDMSRNPLFDAALVLQDDFEIQGGKPARIMEGLSIKPYSHANRTSKFDLTLFVNENETEEKLDFRFEYCTKLFRKETILEFINYFKRIVSAVLAAPGIKISEIEIISSPEKERILYDFNNTASDYPGNKSIHQLFAEQAEKTPQKIAVVFEGQSITYNQLNKISGKLAAYIGSRVLAGERAAAVMVDYSLEMVIGILAILKAGGAYLPISVDYPEARQAYMLKDSSVEILMTDCRHKYKHAGSEVKEVISLDDPGIYNLEGNIECNFGFNHLAYIIYTSGSTGTPKGVMVEHRNVVRLVKNTNYIEFRRQDRILQTGALEFDASTFEIWGALLNGLTLYLINKEKLITPPGLKDAIIKYGITTLWLTSPLFNQMLQADIEIFSGLVNLLVGGDILSPPHINRLRHCFPGLNVINGYGPTENTTFSTTYLIDKEYTENIPIGRPIANSTVYILDRWGYLQPVHIAGELYAGGDGAARGYLNNPELTAEKFDHDLWDYRDYHDGYHRSSRSYRSYISKKIYKTGDLARWLADGNIEFLGRMDQQVKIRGFRIEPGEIENHLLSHDHIHGAVVLTKKDANGDKYLCAYIVSDRDLQSLDLRTFLSSRLPDYMNPSYFVLLERIPLTPNGKVDWRNLPEPETTVTGNEYAAPRDEIEDKLAETWSSVLGIEKNAIGIDAGFFELGGHSLKAALLLSKIHKAFHVNVPLTEIFTNPFIRTLAAYIKKSAEDKHISIEPVEIKDYYVLSSPQKRLYVLQQMDPGGTAYNIPSALMLEGSINKEKLADTFRRLIKRHESLRTSFNLLREEPVQKIHDENYKFQVTAYKQIPNSKLQIITIIKDFIRPFDLSKAPLLRVGLIELAHAPAALRGHRHFSQEGKEGKYLLMVDMHHIISDGVSMKIFVEEFMAIHREEKLQPLRLQYKDYSRWQTGKEIEEPIKNQENYWLAMFSDEIPLLNLPFDYPRPAIQSFAGSRVSFNIGEKETAVLNKLAFDRGGTLYMVLFTAFIVLLSKLSGQEDIIVGTAVANRLHADLQGIIGMFVNTLALRNRIDSKSTFKELLSQVKAKVLKAFENQGYPFEKLVEKVTVNRDASRNPLFDVMFSMRNTGKETALRMGEKGPYQAQWFEFDTGITHFDLMLNGVERDEQLHFTIEYRSKLFKKETILRFISFFKRILADIVGLKDRKVLEMVIVSEEEKQRILYDFNDTVTDYPGNKTIQALFDERVEKAPDRTAVVFEEESITYGELKRRADSLAGFLYAKGSKKEDAVGIMMKRRLEMVIGVLGILKGGGCYLPINSKYPQERKTFILNDSHSRILLTDEALTSSSHGVEVIDVRGLEYEALPTGQGDDAASIGGANDHTAVNLAYIIYTSGSTGNPKGVMVEHKNVVRLVKNTNYIDFPGEYKLLQTGALEFDASTFEIWGALLNGRGLYLVNEDTILTPKTLKEKIQKYGITTMWMTAPLFNQVLDTDMEIFAPLKNLLVGGDVLSPPHINRAKERFPRLNLINGYGPTENTTFSTTYSINKGFKEKIPIGKPIANSTAYIVDKDDRLVPVGVIGELLVGGDGTARGYLNNPELTNSKFQIPNNPGYYRSDRSYKSHALYRTGDLARWLADGNIEFLGRMDQQVKIRGFRIEPGEIENHLLSHDGIHEAVVLTKKDENGDRYLCAYIVSGRDLQSPDLRTFLSARLPDYMIPSYFVLLERIPLTPNGKVDWRNLPGPETTGTGNKYAAPRDEIEDKLAETWSSVLGIEKNAIGIDAGFFELGGHSLKAALLLSKIHKAFHVDVPLTEIFTNPFIRTLAAYIKKAEEDKHIAIEPVEIKDYYVLSSPQKRLYVLREMVERSIGYNIPSVLILEGGLDKDKLEHIFVSLIKRHESLRTSFHLLENEPVQRVHEQVEFEIEYDQSLVNGHWSLENCQGRGEVPSPVKVEKIIRAFIRPFDLSQAPLLRVGLIEFAHTPAAFRGHRHFSQKAKEGKYLLMVDMHHIISDGLSMKIFVEEFMAIHGEEELQPLRLQYKDYSQWRESHGQAALLKKQQEYWREEFAGEIPLLDLPTDFVRPALQGFDGASLYFEMGAAKSSALKHLALKEDVTLFMLLLTLYGVFLSKICNQRDIVIGTPIAARRHPDLEIIVGMFVNTLAIRIYPLDDISFGKFLEKVKTKTVRAFENQDYPYEKLVEIAGVSRDSGGNPLFDTMFALQNVGIPQLEIPGLKLSPYGWENPTAKFDLMLQAVAEKENCLFTFEYSTKLFKEETLNRFISYFKVITARVVENPAIKLSEIEIISGEEKQQILYEFTGTVIDYPGQKTIHELFENQEEKTPDNIALGQGNMHLTYDELNRASRRVARELIEKGVKVDCIVGIMVERSIEMIIGVLGILKANGAYLPIDPGYPPDRVKFMMADSSAGVLVTLRSLVQRVERLKNREGEVILLDEPPAAINTFASVTRQRQPAAGPANLAYVIYTSGSTGRPKGVAVAHRNVIRLVKNTNYINFKSSDRMLQTSALEFDVSTFEIWGTLLNGLTLYLVDKETILTPDKLKKSIADNQVTAMWFTSPLFNQLVQSDTGIFTGLRDLLVGGDVVSPTHINRVRDAFPGLNIINGYGPTENTTFSTAFLIDKDYKERIPIGKPIANSFAYIVDRNERLQPIGVSGELWVGGEGVSRGYLNNPELTAEKFDHDLWDYRDYQDKRKKVPCKRTRFNRSYRSYKSYIYKTGDLARWLPDGNIEFLGRLDHQVKIRGFRIELDEIKNRLLTSKYVKETVVTVRKDETGDKYLCAYIVPRRESSVDHSFSITGLLKNHLSQTLPDYMTPAFFVYLNKIPLTPNGKVDLKNLPQPGVRDQAEAYIAPGDELEKRVVEIWSEVLGIEKDLIGIDANFFQLGGHSLKATIMAAKIHKQFNVKIPVAEIFKKPVIRKVSEYIKGEKKEIYTPMEAGEEKEYYPLSSAQKRLYILMQMDELSIAYNMPLAFTLEGDVELNRLENTFAKLIKRHESLRTSFGILGEEPIQKIDPTVEFQLEYYRNREQFSLLEVEEILENFVRPFDLKSAALLRVGLIELPRTPAAPGGQSSQKGKEHKYILMVDMHHIISDGISVEILINEFTVLYGGVELPPLKLQYKDYSQWQTGDKEIASVKKQEQYWKKQFEDGIPLLDLPTDFARSAVRDFAGSISRFDIGIDITRVLKNYARQEETTLNMMLLAIYDIFLSKLCHQEEIVMGIPIAGRRHADLNGIIGMFVNSLAVKGYPAGDKTFREFLREVKTKIGEAHENQDYQYENLVEALAVDVNREPGRNPMFDTMFVLQDIGFSYPPSHALPGLKLKPYEYKQRTSKFDLSLQGFAAAEKLLFIFEYSTKLFKAETIDRFARYFKHITASLPGHFEEKISAIELISAAEKIQILHEFNGTRKDYPTGKTLHELFENQVEQTPDRIAITSDAESVTYIQLNEKANQLARKLKAKGVCADGIVGISANPSIEMLMGIPAVLKAGGAYMPIEPDYPEESIKYVLEDSGARLLLVPPPVEDRWPEGFEIVEIGDADSYSMETGNLKGLNTPHDLSYVIYASDTNGKSRGLMVEHHTVVNALFALFEEYPSSERDTYLLKTSYGFGASPPGVFGPFLKGGGLVIPGNHGEDNPQKIVNIIEKSNITHIFFVPEVFHDFVGVLDPRDINRLSHLEYIFSCGQAWPGSVKKFKGLDLDGGTVLESFYSPTAAFIYTGKYRLTDGDPGDYPRGELLKNTEMYILDKYDHLQPVGIPGELTVGGESVIRGYLNNPGLTANGVVKSPFGESARLYRTSRWGKWRPDGNMEFIEKRGGPEETRGYPIENVPPETMVPPRSAIEEKVVKIWEKLLGKDNIGVTDDFFQAGGSSLKVFLLVSEINKAFNQDFLVTDFFELMTVEKIAQFLAGSQVEASDVENHVIEPAAKKDYYPLSPAQTRMYILQRLAPGNTSYNIPQIVELGQKPQRKKLTETFRKLINRHESLRTSFQMIDGKLRQKVHENVAFDIEYYEIDSRKTREVINGFVRPFDLKKAPLLRVGLIVTRKNPRQYILLLDLHHIIYDGVSQNIMVHEFKTLVDGGELPALKLQYKDYSQWQNREQEKEAIKRQEKYWLAQFAGELPVLNLPTDYVRPPFQVFEGSIEHFAIGKKETRALKKIASQQGATLFMVLLAAYYILLAKISQNEDIVIGTLTTGRGYIELNPIMGMFVNTLALRNYPGGEKPFTSFLAEVKDRTAAAFDNQDYQFEDLVEQVVLKRDVSRNPLFDVMFVLQDIDGEPGEIPVWKRSGYRYEHKTSRFDMNVAGVEIGDSLAFAVEYCTKLFKKETIRRFIGHFRRIVSSLCRDPGKKIAEIPFIAGQKIKQALDDKIHGSALPGSAAAGAVAMEDHPPANEIEKKLVKIWQRVLDREKISVTGNFFEMGGNSIKALRIVSLIHKEWEIELGLEKIYNAPTIKGIGEIIAGKIQGSIFQKFGP